MNETEDLVQRILVAVTNQGKGLQANDELTERIKGAVNAQAQGLRMAQQRIAQLEAVVSRLANQNMMAGGPPVRQLPRGPMRVVNPLPSNVRALPARFTETDDETADGDYEYEEDESEAG